MKAASLPPRQRGFRGELPSTSTHAGPASWQAAKPMTGTRRVIRRFRRPTGGKTQPSHQLRRSRIYTLAKIRCGEVPRSSLSSLSLRACWSGRDRAPIRYTHDGSRAAFQLSYAVVPHQTMRTGVQAISRNHAHLILTQRCERASPFCAFSHHAPLPPLFRDSSHDRQG